MRHRIYALLSAYLLLNACLPPTPVAELLNVAVTVEPQAWLVDEIGRERVRIQVAVAAGESPETYQPSDAEASQLLAAKIYFRIGVPAENGPWFEAIASSGRSRLVDLRGVDLSRGDPPAASGFAAEHSVHDGSADEHDSADPHIWLSPRRLQEQARIVAAALIEADPSGEAAYRAGLADIMQRLRELDRDLESLLAPYRGRSFLIYHPAWGHFAADYGLRQLAVEVDGKTPSEAELTALQGLARQQKCAALFVQPQISDRVAGLVASSLGVPLETLDPLARDLPVNLRVSARKIAATFAVSESSP